MSEIEKRLRKRYHQLYYEANRQKMLDRAKAYAKANRERVNAQARERRRKAKLNHMESEDA